MKFAPAAGLGALCSVENGVMLLLLRASRGPASIRVHLYKDTDRATIGWACAAV